MITKEEFSQRLKQALDDKKMKQLELAKKVGTSRANISNYLRGNSFPPLDVLAEIAKALDVSLDWLCNLETDPQNKQPKTLGDIARGLVFLEKSAAEIYLDTLTKNEQIITDHDGVSGYPNYANVEVDYPFIVFTNRTLATFILDWKKIKALHDAETIDDDLYNLWIDKHIAELDSLPAIQAETNHTGANNPFDDSDDDFPF